MTGSYQKQVEEQFKAISAAIDAHGTTASGLLGPSPSQPDCIKFRGAVAMGIYNVRTR